MKRAVASKSSHNKEKVRSVKGAKSQQSAKVLKLKIPKKRQIGMRNLVLVCLVVGLFLWSVYPLKQRAQHERNNRLLQSKINKLRAKNNALEDEVKRLKSDDYIEQLARRDFDLVKPGETSVLVVAAKKDEIQEEKPQAQDNKTKKEEPKAESKNEAEKNKKEPRAISKNNEEKKKTGRSWWQKMFGFLDNLTGLKSR